MPDERLFPVGPPPYWHEYTDDPSDTSSWHPPLPGPVRMERGLKEHAESGTGDHAARLILELGTDYEPTERPAGVPPGLPHSCFYNAHKLASERAGYQFVVGYGTHPSEPNWPMRHAWCIDESGAVVDPSWSYADTAALRGIVLPLEFAEPFCEERSTGPLDMNFFNLDEVAAAAGLEWQQPPNKPLGGA